MSFISNKLQSLFGIKNNTSDLSFENLDAIDFEKKLENTTNSILLDVRTPLETKSGNIKDALEINFMDAGFVSCLEHLDKSAHYFVYCRSGNRSYKACQKMHQMGFEHIHNLKGGILSWNF